MADQDRRSTQGRQLPGDVIGDLGHPIPGQLAATTSSP